MEIVGKVGKPEGKLEFRSADRSGDAKNSWKVGKPEGKLEFRWKLLEKLENPKEQTNIPKGKVGQWGGVTIYIYIYRCIQTHIDTYIDTCMCTYTYIYTHMHAYTYTYRDTHVHAYAYICVCIHTHI